MLGDDGLDSRANDGTKHLLTAARRAAAFMDWWTMDSTNLCSTDCKTTIQLGTTLGIYAGTRQIWPSILDGAVPSASDADNPTEAELESLGMSMTGAMCSAKSPTASSMVLATEKYIVGESVSKMVDDPIEWLLRKPMIQREPGLLETMLTTYYSPTEYGAGSCSKHEFRNMWAKMAQLGTRYAVKLLENRWEGDYDYYRRDYEYYRIFQPAALAGIIVGTLVGLCCCFLGCALAFLFYQKLQQQKMKNSTVVEGSELTDAAPRSPVVKATGELMKGINGSLRNMGGALFGANKSSPGEPEKPKITRKHRPFERLGGWVFVPVCVSLDCAVCRLQSSNYCTNEL